MARIALFALGMATLLAIHLFEGGHLHQLVQPGAALLCIAVPLGLVMAIYGAAAPRRTLNAFLPGALSKAPGEDSFDGQHSRSGHPAEMLAGLRMLCLGMCGLSVTASVIVCTFSLDDPSRLGPGVALGLLSLIYAVGFAELCIAPLLDRLALASSNPAENTQLLPKAAQQRSLVIDLGILALVTGCAGAVMWEMGRLDAFLFSSALAFVMVSIPLNIAFHGWRGHYSAFVAGYSPAEASAQQRAQHVLVLRSARGLFYALGSLGLLVGLVHILGDLSDSSKIADGLAVAMLAPLYSLAIAELFISPRIARLQAAGGLSEGTAAPLAAAGQETRAPLRLAVTTIFAGLLLFFLCMLAVQDDPTSRFHESNCCDRVDNDGDELIDSADPDCRQLKIECPEPKEASGVGTAPRLSKEAARALTRGPAPTEWELQDKEGSQEP